MNKYTKLSEHLTETYRGVNVFINYLAWGNLKFPVGTSNYQVISTIDKTIADAEEAAFESSIGIAAPVQSISVVPDSAGKTFSIYVEVDAAEKPQEATTGHIKIISLADMLFPKHTNKHNKSTSQQISEGLAIGKQNAEGTCAGGEQEQQEELSDTSEDTTIETCAAIPEHLLAAIEIVMGIEAHVEEHQGSELEGIPARLVNTYINPFLE